MGVKIEHVDDNGWFKQAVVGPCPGYVLTELQHRLMSRASFCTLPSPGVLSKP